MFYLKSWGLTSCTCFGIMARRGIEDAQVRCLREKQENMIEANARDYDCGYRVQENIIQGWIWAKGIPEAKIMAGQETIRLGKSTSNNYARGCLDAIEDFLDRHVTTSVTA